ncbi:MAG: sulfatase [bacterium]|nr:sulfatase [bacterium]
MKKPNIVLIQCHDLGRHIGCYPNNSALTPHLDRLASEGVVFDRHFSTSPTCSPSRGSLLTGMYPHKHGLMALTGTNHWAIHDDLKTIPELLKDAGYATAHFGIWHITETPEGRVDLFDLEAKSEVAADNAIQYLKQRDETSPFCLMVGLEQPHLPFTDSWNELQAPEDMKIPGYLADHPDIREEFTRFYGEVSRADLAAGRIIEALKEQKLHEDTLVIFTTDHGIAMPLAKGTLYDPGIHISLLVSFPKLFEGGRRFSGMTSNIDILPTILDIAQEAERIPVDIDGRSLKPFLEKDRDVGREYVYTGQTWHDFYEPIRAIRTQKYKLIRNFEPGPGLQLAADILQTRAVKVMQEELRNRVIPEYEFYDLDADPLERNNLSGTAEIKEKEMHLQQTLQDWLEASSDPIISGVVPAPVGYLEHFLTKPNGPGGFISDGPDRFVFKWKKGFTEHVCGTKPLSNMK